MSDYIYFVLASSSNKVVDVLENVIHKLIKNAIMLKPTDGISAYNIIEKQTKPVVVLLDANISQLNGMQILNKIVKNEKLSMHHYIYLQTNDNQQETVDAIKAGADDILIQPLTVDKLILKVRNAKTVIEYKLKANNLEEENKILEKQVKTTSESAIEILSAILNEIFPKQEFIKQVFESATWIAGQMCSEKKDILDTSKAARIAYAGKLYLNENFMAKPVMNDGMVQNEKMEKVPSFVKKLLGEIEAIEDIYKILYHIYENFDGSGIPEKVKGWKIPVGSRILRVCMDFMEFYDRYSKKSNKAMDSLFKESKRLYDHRVLAYYDQFLAAHPKFSGSRHNETPVVLKQLEEGMVLSRNIITDSGLKLAPSGQVLNEAKIDRILTISATDPILGKIYIQY